MQITGPLKYNAVYIESRYLKQNVGTLVIEKQKVKDGYHYNIKKEIRHKTEIVNIERDVEYSKKFQIQNVNTRGVFNHNKYEVTTEKKGKKLIINGKMGELSNSIKIALKERTLENDTSMIIIPELVLKTGECEYFVFKDDMGYVFSVSIELIGNEHLVLNNRTFSCVRMRLNYIDDNHHIDMLVDSDTFVPLRCVINNQVLELEALNGIQVFGESND